MIFYESQFSMILPEHFCSRMKEILGTEFQEFQNSLEQEAITTIRVNTSKYKETPRLDQINYCSTGYSIPKRPIFTLDPFIHSGIYYVQEPSSMFLEQIMKQLNFDHRIKALDLCASPGGKSTHLSSLLPANSLLVANDVIRSRSQILSENLKKWGDENVIVTNNDPHDFQRLPDFFDLILVDAPCSGEGLFRRDPNAIEEWSPDNAQLCAQRQQRIVADVWPALKEGGILIYSTCTFNTAENEDNIQWLNEFAEIENVPLEISAEWGITTSEINGFSGYRFYPHKVVGEGLFIAVVQKGGNGKDSDKRKAKDHQLNASKAEKEFVRELLIPGEFEILKFENSLLTLPSIHMNDFNHVKSNLRIVHAGVKIGEIKQNDLIPNHDFGLSRILNREAYPEIDLTIEEALRYLKRDEISPISSDKGWNLVTYRDMPLGWVKNLGNRYNSAFPKEWRIRMSISEFTGEKLKDEMIKFPL